MEQKYIRNFSIIAHVDHGKSTLADRMMLFTGAIDERTFKNQMLDTLDLERERGITIKAAAVRLIYKAKDGIEYMLNIIDTPGHVDFCYEVEKSLHACEGALLVADASQGVESQTVANHYLAKQNNLTLVPVLNKIDIANIELEDAILQMMELFEFDFDDVKCVSAKEGTNIEELMETIVTKLPAPQGQEDGALKALIFDMKYDVYRGVLIYVRIINGVLKPGMKIRMMHTGKEYGVETTCVFVPEEEKINELTTGMVGVIACNIYDPQYVRVGDTITDPKNPTPAPLPGYRQLKPLVYCGVYPVSSGDFMDLREAMSKLKLNDPSFTFEPEVSQSFGNGFRCGFLGLLHMEVIQERLEREYDMDLILTTPNVGYRFVMKNGDAFDIENPAELPKSKDVDRIEEPIVTVSILSPVTGMDGVMELCKRKRGEFIQSDYISERMKIVYDIPLSEVIVDFNDMVKSVTRGYGSVDFVFKGYQKAPITTLDIMINGEPVDAFSCFVHKERAYDMGQKLVTKLKELIPQQLFEVKIQASSDGRIISSAKVRSTGKNVTAKCYGGDISRKRKLWEKQKEGKKRMKAIGKVEVPQEAFLAALKLEQ